MTKKKTTVYLTLRNGVMYSLYFSAQVPMNDDIMGFIEDHRSLPQNYQTYLEGVKSRAEVFIMLEFLPTPHPTKKYPTKKDIVRYLENLGSTYSKRKVIVPASKIDQIVKSIEEGYYYYTKWKVVEYEVEVDHSMILRRPTSNEMYFEFVRKLFHYGEYRTSNTK